MRSSEPPPVQVRPTVVLLEASQERFAIATSALANTAVVTRDLGILAAPGGVKTRIVLVDLAANLERALQRLEEVHAAVPQVQIVALAAKKDPDVILRAMRAGACEFALLGEGSELAGILGKLFKRAAAEEAGGAIIAVFPAKGGIGATTVAINLAGALCAKGKRVLVVDLDRHLGDVFVSLDMTPRYSLADIVGNLHRLDGDLLLSSLDRHPSGIYVVAQPDSLEGGDTIAPAQVSALLRFAALHFDFVLCDGLYGFDELSLAVLDASSRIELLLAQDVISLKNAKRCLDIFHRLDYDEKKVSLVVNRFHKKSPIDRVAITENVGLPVRAVLTNDSPSVLDAVNRGVLLKQAAPRSQLTADIDDLAATLAGTPETKRRGGFGALFRRNDPAETENAPSPAQSIDKKVGHPNAARRTPQTS
jgi:pilus assembly protein CpaE